MSSVTEVFVGWTLLGVAALGGGLIGGWLIGGWRERRRARVIRRRLRRFVR